MPSTHSTIQPPKVKRSMAVISQGNFAFEADARSNQIQERGRDLMFWVISGVLGLYYGVILGIWDIFGILGASGYTWVLIGSYWEL